MLYSNYKGIEGVSIVIRAYNEARYLPLCLRAIFSQSIDVGYEVILVDSGSSDETVLIAQSYGCRIVEIPKEDFTFGYSLNVGVSRARHEFIVVISAHCVPTDKHWLARLVAPLVTGQAQLTFGSHQADPTARCSEYNYFEQKYNVEKRRGPLSDHFNNGNSAFIKMCWRYKRFDERIKGQEDVLFARWHSAHGAQIQYVHNAAVVHYHNYSNYSLLRRVSLDSEVNVGLMLDHGYSRSEMLLTAIDQFKRDVRLSYQRGVVIKAFPGILCFRAIQTIGYLIGYLRFLRKKHVRDLYDC